MKKIENPKWEECRIYLRNKVLPRLQEMQRDMFGNEKLFLEIGVGRNGEYIYAYASASENNFKDTIYLNLSFAYSRKQIDSELSKLTDLIRKHTA